MIFTFPKLTWLIVLSAILPLTGFWMIEQYGDIAAWLTAGFLNASSLLATIEFLMFWYEEYKSLLGVSRETIKPPIFTTQTPQDTRKIPNLSETPSQVYSSTVERVVFDRERHFARHILKQIEAGFQPKFTEEYWIDSGRFGASRPVLTAMLANWQAWGIIGKKHPKNKNSTYILLDERRVRLIVGGEPLPLHPSLTSPPL